VLAIGALRAIADAGLRVPADISLLSYDDISFAKYMTPRLTTVSKDISSLGRTAVQLLLARLQEPDRPYQTVKRPARLIIRESTGSAPF
jgi:LacI family transcriptional regulator